ncbi:MAG: peptidyl-prolyl cis-trans isomerase [Clostridia bacterium]|nr:peptidyl-prolyl cis-trans isomerase [Clostridia bacterium]
MKRIIAALTALVLSAVFVSCGSSSAAVSCGGAEISAREYQYWLKTSAEYYLSSLSGASDTPEFWNGEVSEGVSMRDYLLADVELSVKSIAAALAECERIGLKLTDDVYDAIDQDIEDMSESYGGDAELNRELSGYGINKSILRDIYEKQEKEAALYEYWYGDEGIYLPSDAELDAFYQENYIRIQYIALHYPESGDTAAEDQLAETLKVSLEAGADYSALSAEYNDDDLSTYPDGVYLSRSDLGFEIVSKAFELGVGETGVIKQQSAVYVVKRLPLVDNAYMTDETGQLSDIVELCSERLYASRLEARYGDVKVNQDVIAEAAAEVFGG